MNEKSDAEYQKEVDELMEADLNPGDFDDLISEIQVDWREERFEKVAQHMLDQKQRSAVMALSREIHRIFGLDAARELQTLVCELEVRNHVRNIPCGCY